MTSIKNLVSSVAVVFFALTTFASATNSTPVSEPAAILAVMAAVGGLMFFRSKKA